MVLIPSAYICKLFCREFLNHTLHEISLVEWRVRYARSPRERTARAVLARSMRRATTIVDATLDSKINWEISGTPMQLELIPSLANEIYYHLPMLEFCIRWYQRRYN